MSRTIRGRFAETLILDVYKLHREGMITQGGGVAGQGKKKLVKKMLRF